MATGSAGFCLGGQLQDLGNSWTTNRQGLQYLTSHIDTYQTPLLDEMTFSMGMSWSEGEKKMHELLQVPIEDNPTSAMLTPQASFMLQRAPLLAIGTLDDQSRPWTALWGGAPGFSESIGGGFVGTRTLVDGKHDPVVQALVGSTPKGELLQPQDGGKMLSGLAIDLVTRKRVKIAGKMAAGTVREVDFEAGDNIELPEDVPKTQNQIQMITKIEQSLGNCPKYLNQYELRPTLITPKLIAQGANLSPEGNALINKADMFFLSTASTTDMDTNHRGGPPGFVRIISPTRFIYPEYSGNRLYQSLGNLQLNPLIGITFPDYETGDVLYMTGTATVLVGTEAASIMPGTNLAVRVDVTETRFVAQGLAFRGKRKIDGSSPYNPLVRTLASEGNIKSSFSISAPKIASLIAKTPLTPTIARFTFHVPGGVTYKAGQWVAFNFKDDLDIGYSHMRNDDPKSLNDDYARTFTITSQPSASGKDEDFEITIRKVGPVTEHLFRQNERAGTKIPILGIGGEFEIKQGETITPFIAGGVGITPLLGLSSSLNLDPLKFRLLWTVKKADVGLVVDTLKRYPGLAPSTEIFVTGLTLGGEEVEIQERLLHIGVKLHTRRLARSDLDTIPADRWYLCGGKTFRKQVTDWLPGKEVVFENFDY